MPDASVVVVTHNALPWIERCLESVRGEEVIVVDNGSSDGSADVVREQLPEAQVIEQENARPRRGLEPGHGGGVGPLLPDPELGRVADRRLVAAARCLRGPAPGRGDRRAAAAEPRRLAAALGAGLPDALAARDRVLLPAQARAALAGAERVLRRRVRPSGGARGGVPDGRVHARPARGRRAGRAARRGVLPLQRGDGLGLPLPRGGLEGALLPRTPSACTSAARRTAAACSARTCAGTFASSRSTVATRTPSGRGSSCARPRGCAACSSAATAAACTARRPTGSRRRGCRSCSADDARPARVRQRRAAAPGRAREPGARPAQPSPRRSPGRLRSSSPRWR